MISIEEPTNQGDYDFFQSTDLIEMFFKATAPELVKTLPTLHEFVKVHYKEVTICLK